MSEVNKSTNLDDENSANFTAKTTKSKRKNLEFEQAREYIQSQMIPSVKAYYEWWDLNKPKAIPRRPERAYANQWQGWNDFLGNKNQWQANNQHNYRPYDEGVLFAQKLNLESQNEWLEWCAENIVPDDIPKRPDLHYKEWLGWSHWLGKTAANKVEARQLAVENNVAVFFIAKDADISIPSNVYMFGVEHEGIAALKNKWSKNKVQVFKLFRYDSRCAEAIQHYIKMLSSPWYGDDRQRICANIWDICWEFSSLMDEVDINLLSQ